MSQDIFLHRIICCMTLKRFCNFFFGLLLLSFFRNNFLDTAKAETCGDERTKWGFALVNHTFKSVKADNFAGCLLKCNQDKQCKSFNFWWNSLRCEFNNVTKYSAPKSFICKVNCIQRDMTRRPAGVSLYRSCKDVHPSCGDGEYSVDPTSSGEPFTVYCDTTTEGGGWTLIFRVVLQSSTPPQSYVPATHYRDLSKYRVIDQMLPSPVLLELKKDVGYKQLRFFCHKKQVNTVIHIMTNNDDSGEAVVKFFADDDYKAARPQACGSFTALPGDNSTLSVVCGDWGWDGVVSDGKWGKSGKENKYRLYEDPMIERYHSIEMRGQKFKCDDVGRGSGYQPMTSGDTWEIYVR